MKKVLMGILVMTTLAAGKLQAQSMGSEYRTAVGIKFYPGALTLKHFMADNKAVEGIGYFWNHGFRLTGLYEIHGDINGAPGLKWYVGPGAHVGVWNNRAKGYYNGNPSGAYLGIDGVLGLDYKIEGAPINLSIDWQPSFTFGKYVGFDGGWGGFAVRYTF